MKQGRVERDGVKQKKLQTQRKEKVKQKEKQFVLTFFPLQFHFILVPTLKREMLAEDSIFTADWKNQPFLVYKEEQICLLNQPHYTHEMCYCEKALSATGGIEKLSREIYESSCTKYKSHHHSKASKGHLFQTLAFRASVR